MTETWWGVEVYWYAWLALWFVAGVGLGLRWPRATLPRAVWWAKDVQGNAWMLGARGQTWSDRFSDKLSRWYVQWLAGPITNLFDRFHLRKSQHPEKQARGLGARSWAWGVAALIVLGVVAAWWWWPEAANRGVIAPAYIATLTWLLVGSAKKRSQASGAGAGATNADEP